MGAKYTEAQKRATMKYQKENTSLIGIRVSKEKRALYQSEAEKAGKSLSAFIIDIVDEKIAES
ncbi:MAG: hypothetical protein LIO94_02295 [Clostridiales bacterium]|nr:hypothetical protein [Clostridiales bacterium]